MTAWLRVLGLFVAVVLAALLLKVLPPLLVLALFVGGVAYANHLLTRKPKREPAHATAELLGLRPAPERAAQVLASPFALLSRGSGVDVRDVIAGRWRGTEVEVFGLSSRPSAPADVAVEERAYSCAIAATGGVRPHVIVEPRSFLTSDADRPPLPEVSTGTGSFDRAFAVHAGDQAFAKELLDDDTRAWLLDGERWAFELNDRFALVYAAPVRPADLDLVLEAMGMLLSRLRTADPTPAPQALTPQSDGIPERPDVGDPSRG